MLRIAVIIPARNEADRLPETLRTLVRHGAPEHIVVVDCGSDDETRRVASASGVDVIGGPTLRHRAHAQRVGADHVLCDASPPDVLLFLHADTLLPVGWDAAVRDALRNPSVVGGAFGFQWNMTEAPFHARPLLRLLEFINRARYRLTQRYYGDQGIFARADVYEACGGFRDVALMEDRMLCRDLRRHGRLRVARGRVTTSPRRFVRRGVLRQAIVDLFLVGADMVGADAQRWHERYNEEQ